MIIDVIAGARPNYIKVAALYHAFCEGGYAAQGHEFRLIETGQHYDDAMSRAIALQVGLPEPFAKLHADTVTPGQLLSSIIGLYQQHLQVHRADLTMVVGDVTSTLAGAIAAKNDGIPVAHVEAGLRSGDRSMPEELNRIATDAVSDFLFAPTESAAQNLEDAGLEAGRIYMVGNTMIDTLRRFEKQSIAPEMAVSQQLLVGRYLILTQHRPSNVDNRDVLMKFLKQVAESAGETPVLFPMHPRTQKMISGLELPAAIHLLPPLPYLQMLWLQQHAHGIITDSGGISEEASALGVPCIVTRRTTERHEMIAEGSGVLCLPVNDEEFRNHVKNILEGKWKKGRIPDCWDGRAAVRIWQILLPVAG